MDLEKAKEDWSENILIVDATFLDSLAADFRRHFTSVTGRDIPKADLCTWLDCILLDAGLKPDASRESFVAFIHDFNSAGLLNFIPGSYSDELSKTFRDNMGEFILSSFRIENLTDRPDMVCESIKMALDSGKVKNLIAVTDNLSYGEKVKKSLENADSNKNIFVFSMEKIGLSKIHEDILGYSLLPALGINSAEL